jgi:nicotinamide mononucleotide transporter
MFQWVLKNYLEIAGVVTGLLSLYYSVKEKIWLWPYGIISSAFYIIVYYRTQLYADMSLNAFYVVISIYGWRHWLVQKDNVYHESIKISVLLAKDWFRYLAITLLLTVLFAFILLTVPQELGFTPSSVPWWDAFLSAGSVVATWMLAKKIIEQWLWWIVIDGIYVGIYIYKGLYITVGLFLVYTIMAILGYLKWKKDLQMQ